MVWVKSYSPHYFFQKGFVLTPREQSLFTIEDGGRESVKVLRLNATDGTLITRYQENTYMSYSSGNTEPFLTISSETET